METNSPSHIALKRTLALLSSEAGGQPLASSPPAEGIQGYLPQAFNGSNIHMLRFDRLTGGDEHVLIKL